MHILCFVYNTYFLDTEIVLIFFYKNDIICIDSEIICPKIKKYNLGLQKSSNLNYLSNVNVFVNIQNIIG